MNDAILFKFAELLFGAGIVYATFRRVVKDLNGLGRRVREDREDQEHKFLTDAMTKIALEKNLQERKWLVDKYLGSGRKRS